MSKAAKEFREQYANDNGHPSWEYMLGTAINDPSRETDIIMQQFADEQKAELIEAMKKVAHMDEDLCKCPACKQLKPLII